MNGMAKIVELRDLARNPVSELMMRAIVWYVLLVVFHKARTTLKILPIKGGSFDGCYVRP